jgi:hypothetical protein
MAAVIFVALVAERVTVRIFGHVPPENKPKKSDA